MRVRGLKSLAVYSVNKDSEVFWLDLSLAGYRKVRSGERYAAFFDEVYRWLREYGIAPEEYAASNYVVHMQPPGGSGRTSTVLLVTLTKKGRVVYAALASFTPGVLLRMSSQLEKAGWKSKFFLDFSVRKEAVS
ncbi:hypothetical protein [Infirmifilum sp. SLHALR2]|nr:MAG: hypothetical protein B7L53_05335 [Thermofilum sp. NZ13]